MNVSLNWLKEYVDIDESISIKEITDRLTMSGSKVETYEEFGKKTKNVVTGIVEAISSHPSEESFKVLTMNIGSRVVTAVAKIPDVEVGDIIPVALPGAAIIGKEVKESDVAGVTSECMVCHIEDLGLDAKVLSWCKPSGLIAFPKDVKAGMDVNDVLGLGDYIIEFEITPNRPDCLSIEGMANELALTFGKPLPKVWQYTEPNLVKKDNVSGITVTIDTPNCKRYTMGVANDIIVKDAPYEMQLKLIKCGIRPINNIVDITNYVMLEMGEPLHAFDKEMLASNEIVVRQAKEGESLETLDGIKRNLDSSMMVITNATKPVALAGIMGGETSGIHQNTKSVVIEAANFVRGSIRNTSRKLLLRSDSSGRFEKGLPIDLTVHAMNRVINLMNATVSGTISNGVIDIIKEEQTKKVIDLDYEKINRVIGTKISNDKIDQFLKAIRVEIKEGKAMIPYFREDLEIIEDLSEEIARIYGYDKLEAKLPSTELTFGGKTVEQKIADKLKEIAMANGYSEIYTYTFFSKDTLDRLGYSENNKVYDLVKLSNPLSKDFEYMRTTTVPLMLETLERNYTRKNEEVKLFELGKIFLNANNIQKGELVNEEQRLTLGAYANNMDFYDIKKVVENILNYYKILDKEYDITRIEEESEFHPGISAKITIKGEEIARFGKVSPLVIKNYTLPENTYIAIINFEQVIKYASEDYYFVEPPKYPAVERDISFVIDEDILTIQIEKALKQVEYVEKVELFDVYQGKQIEDKKKSMAYKIFLRSLEKTLNEQDIVQSMTKVFDILENELKATIRK
ncbi:MAG: phenylalanine--tRNA ligase subunit beta [Clostridia bacterium]|nr:phenylalanine--tRNA ligase subunit beta [Clostridia bacterium]